MPVLERAHESSQDYDGREIWVERKPDEKGSWKKAAASWKASAGEGVGGREGNKPHRSGAERVDKNKLGMTRGKRLTEGPG